MVRVDNLVSVLTGKRLFVTPIAVAVLTYLSSLAFCRAPPLREHRQQSCRNSHTQLFE